MIGRHLGLKVMHRFLTPLRLLVLVFEVLILVALIMSHFTCTIAAFAPFSCQVGYHNRTFVFVWSFFR